MRMALQIVLLVAGTVFLLLQIPRKALFPRFRAAVSRPAPSVSYVELGEEEYANRMKLARMAWQVRARAAGRLDLEDGTPLMEDVLPPPKSALGFPDLPPPPAVRFKASLPASLAPPSIAAPEAKPLPPPEDRRRDALLDISSFDSLN